MTRDEAIDVLENIAELYASFQITERKGNLFIPILMKMDYQGVMKNLYQYAQHNPYPPMIAAIAAFPPEENMHLKKVKRWQEEADKVPAVIKESFRDQMIKLMQEKSGS